MNNSTITALVNIPEPLQKQVEEYIKTHPNWSVDRVAAASFSLFLLQNGQDSDRNVAQIYLDSLFNYPLNAA